MSCLGCCFGSNSKKEIFGDISPIEKKSLDKRKSRASVLSAFKKSETSISKNNISNLGEKSIIKSFSRNSVSQSGIEGQLKYKVWEGAENNGAPKFKNSGKKNDVKPHWEYKDKIRCLFCGGVNCKHENFLHHKNPAIIGLHSDYITEDIIASQRPSTVLIKKFDLIKRFKEHNIGLIVNLQREGEHPFCGPNGELEKHSGFTYDPQQFVSEDIKFRPSGWKDMSVPDSVNFILEIVKDMAVTIKEMKSKVLVHCHAGYGRTGVVIACYMLFDSNSETNDIIKLIRRQRPGCVQKDTQYSFCEKFKNFIQNARTVFTANKVSIEHFMKNQKDILYGNELIKYEYIPKIIAVVLEKLIEMMKEKKLGKLQLYNLMDYPEDWNDMKEDCLHNLKLSINKNMWEPFNRLEDPAVIIQLLYDWLEDSINYVINPEKIDIIFKQNDMGDLLKKHLEDPRSFSSENRRTLYESLKSIFRTLEIETLNCIAHFASQIRPESEECKIQYKIMVRSLCFHLLGFNASYIHDKIKVDDINYFQNSANCLSDIIDFLVIISEYDLDDDESNWMSDFSPYVFNRRFSVNSLKDFPLKKFSQLFKQNAKKTNDFSGAKDLNDFLKFSKTNGSPDVNRIKEGAIENNFTNFLNLQRCGKDSPQSIKPDKEFFREIYTVLDDFYKDKSSPDMRFRIQSPSKERFRNFVDHLNNFISMEKNTKDVKKNTAVFMNWKDQEPELKKGDDSKEAEDADSCINLKKINNKEINTLKSSSLKNTSLNKSPILSHKDQNINKENSENEQQRNYGISGIKLRKRNQTQKAIEKIRNSADTLQNILKMDNSKTLTLSLAISKKKSNNYISSDEMESKSENSFNLVENIVRYKNSSNNDSTNDPNYNISARSKKIFNEYGNDYGKSFDKTLTFDNNLKVTNDLKQSVFKY